MKTNYRYAMLCAALIAAPLAASAQGNTPASWDGAYFGGTFGYGYSDNDVKTSGQAAGNITNVNGGARPGSVSLEQDGFLGGAHAGYNWQRNSVVYGVEADIAYTDMDESSNVRTTALNGVDRLNNNFEQELNYLGTVRGRAGYALNQMLVFATGGLAYGSVDNKADFFGPVGQKQFSGSEDGVQIGYTAGGGLEYAFSSRVALKAEYLYYDLGSETVDVVVIPGSGGGGTGYNTKFNNDGHILRTGVSFKF